MIYYELSISRDSERKGGCFVNEYIQALPGILFWVVLFVVIKSVRAKRDEESKHPKNAAQRELVDDVIATIERVAPDLKYANVSYAYYNKTGGIYFQSWSGYGFSYDYAAHGYKNVSCNAAMFVAGEIAKHFGGGRGTFGRDYDGDFFQVWIPKE